MQAATLLSQSRWNLCCCASCSKGPENSLRPAVAIKFSPLQPEQLGKGAEDSETQEMGVGPPLSWLAPAKGTVTALPRPPALLPDQRWRNMAAYTPRVRPGL